MTARCKALAAVALVGLAGGTASASVSYLTFNVTNNTSQAWTSLLFEIRAPLGGTPVDPVQLAAVLFDSNIALHTTTQPLATAGINESGKQVTFTFDASARPAPGQNASYTVVIDNPFDSPFRIVRIATPVPTPGAAALGVMGVGLAAFRRRRSA